MVREDIKKLIWINVIASDQIKFKLFNGKEIDVRGWVNEKSDDLKKDWIQTYSDHSLLFFQIEKQK